MTTQTKLTGGREASRGWAARAKPIVFLERRPLVYNALVVFFALYYYRLEDFIKVLAYIPMARVAGAIAFLALLLGMLGGSKVRTPKAVRMLWLLLVQMAICVPFALWPGG